MVLSYRTSNTLHLPAVRDTVSAPSTEISEVRDRTAPREFSALLFGSFGDSGGPVHAGGRLIGILSRPSGIPFVCGVISTRADAAVADAARSGAIGGTFRPLA